MTRTGGGGGRENGGRQAAERGRAEADGESTRWNEVLFFWSSHSVQPTAAGLVRTSLMSLRASGMTARCGSVKSGNEVLAPSNKLCRHMPPGHTRSCAPIRPLPLNGASSHTSGTVIRSKVLKVLTGSLRGSSSANAGAIAIGANGGDRCGWERAACCAKCAGGGGAHGRCGRPEGTGGRRYVYTSNLEVSEVVLHLPGI